MYILHCSRFPGSLEMDSCIIIIIKISSAEHSPLGATSHGTLKSVSAPRLPKKPSGFNIFVYVREGGRESRNTVATVSSTVILGKDENVSDPPP